MAKAHKPKPAPVEAVVEVKPITVRAQRAIPAAAKNGSRAQRYPRPTTDSRAFDPVADARQLIIESVKLKTETPCADISELTGYSGHDLKRFIEGVLADYVQTKHIDPLVRAETPAKKKCPDRRSPEARARASAATKDYWARKRAEKAAANSLTTERDGSGHVPAVI